MHARRSCKRTTLSATLTLIVALSACGSEDSSPSEPESYGNLQIARTTNQGLETVALQDVPSVEPFFGTDSTDRSPIEFLDEVPAPAPATSIAKPRVATYFLRSSAMVDNPSYVGRFGFVISGFDKNGQARIDALRKANPSVKLASYTVLIEADTTPSTSSVFYEPNVAVANNDWWLYNADGQHVTWTSTYGTHLVNVTAWAPTDASGRRYPQWLGDYYGTKFGDLRGLDYIMVDNVWYMPRPRTGATGAMDWKRNGTNQLSTDPAIQTAFREGQAAYFSRLRSKLPGIKIFGNADNTLDYPEFKGKLEGAMFECAFGKSWSALNRGWDGMMAHYRAQLANAASPKDVVLQGCGPNGLELNLLRFGLASTLLDDGWFAYTITGESLPYWADEYSAPLGTAAEAPPSAPTASGIWMRKYTNGMVLVNPTATTASVNIGSGYKRLSGTQDPVINNGMPVSTVTLLPKTGLIVVKQ